MTTNEYIENLIHNLLNENNFPLIPYTPIPDNDLKISFDFFSNLTGDIILKNLIKEINHTNFKNAINIVSHYKGKIKFFDNSLSFNDYTVIKPHLDDSSKARYRDLFFNEYVDTLLGDNSYEIDNEFLDYILSKDLDTYIKITLKLNIPNVINKIFLKNPEKVFDFINLHKNKYLQLIELNQPQFIFSNMNGKLNITDETLKYFFEICPMDINIYKELRKSFSFETIWNQTNNKLSPEFYVEILYTVDDFIFLIKQKNIKISSLNLILEKVKLNFPHIYENLDSLIFLKNDFHNK